MSFIFHRERAERSRRERQEAAREKRDQRRQARRGPDMMTALGQSEVDGLLTAIGCQGLAAVSAAARVPIEMVERAATRATVPAGVADAIRSGLRRMQWRK